MSAKTPVVLLTGFEPFGGQAVNPSWLAVQQLHGRRIAGHRLVARWLPVAFGHSLKVLRALLRELKPAMVVAVGQAGGRAPLSLERVAINIDDARIPDNAGRQPVDVPVVADGPAAYFATLPIKAMREAIAAAGLPVEISQTAGTFVCNHVFYALMHRLRRNRGVRAGFVHLPPLSGEFTLPVLERALRICIETALSTACDARIAAGAVD